MSMKHPLHIWIIFGVCLAVLLAAVGWVSAIALRFDRAETQARQGTAFEEKVRLALWRMDSALAPLLVQESAWPYFFYRTFYRTNHASGKLPSPSGMSPELMVRVAPSPL